MGVHGGIVLRQFLKKVNMARNIRKHFNPGLDHGSYLAKVQVLFNHGPDVGLCHLIELLKIHGLHILAVHPAQLGHIKYGR